MDSEDDKVSFSYVKEGCLDFELSSGDIVRVEKINSSVARVFFVSSDGDELYDLYDKYTMFDSVRNIVPPFKEVYGYFISRVESYELCDSKCEVVLNIGISHSQDISGYARKAYRYHDQY